MWPSKSESSSKCWDLISINWILSLWLGIACTDRRNPSKESSCSMVKFYEKCHDKNMKTQLLKLCQKSQLMIWSSWRLNLHYLINTINQSPYLSNTVYPLFSPSAYHTHIDIFYNIISQMTHRPCIGSMTISFTYTWLTIDQYQT